MSDPINPFGDFEDDFKNVDKAEQGSSIGRLPEGTYKVACASVNLGDDILVDHQVFAANSGTKGFKLFFEVLEPEMIGETRVKGEIIEHVFWITRKSIPFIKRDAAIILGRDLQSLGEMDTIAWAGKTCEVVVADEEYNGRTNSKVKYINPWASDVKRAATPKTSASKKVSAEVDF